MDKNIKKPMVSVIMSVYNGKKYLKEAINSVLNQTFSDFEFIIIDDGSIDKTPEILKNYAKKDSRTKIITNAQNIGLTKSLNKAIQRSSGKYLARMDADDISLPNRLYSQVNFLEKHNEIGVVGCNYYEINEKGDIMGEKHFPSSSKKLKRSLIKFNPIVHSSAIIRKKALLITGLYDESIPSSGAQDYDLWFRIIKFYEVANLNELLIKRRYSSKMISLTEENKQILWAIKARKKAIKRKQYPKKCYFYLIRPFIVLKTPLFLRKFLRKYILRKKIYG